ncbi:MAG: transglycosylase SLT domain-containing protein [Acidimicrobiales bacterium]
MTVGLAELRRGVETLAVMANAAGTASGGANAPATTPSANGRAAAQRAAQVFAAALADATATAETAAAPSTEADSTAPLTLDTAQLAALTTATPQQRNLGDGVVLGALDHLGTPYLWGGNDPETGIDCSALVRTAFREIGVDMPRVSRDQATMGIEVGSIDDALPGDLLAFGEPVNHVAIYLGDNKMVHAPRSGEVVKVEEIDRPITTIRRVVDTQRPSGATWTSLDADRSFGPEELQALFVEAGNRWDIDPALLAAVAQVESNFDPDAVSPAGAVGLMQFMPATAAGLGVDPTDPASSIDGAAQYLRQNLDQFGSISLALAAYNAGPGNVAKYGGIPPFDETQRYVRQVQAIWSANAA